MPVKTIGGTERIVQYLIEELVKKGHEVTLLGHKDSTVPAGVQFIGTGSYLEQENTVKTVWRHLLTNRYDVIHNHGRLLFFMPKMWSKTRKVHTFHMGELDGQGLQKFIRLKPLNTLFTPCGDWITAKYQRWGGKWKTVNNGLPGNKYKAVYDIDGDAPLVFIGRVGATKGVEESIHIAKASGKKLLIAGKVGDYPHEIEWFETRIKPKCDGEQIKFIGAVDDEQKQVLLGNALALLLPVLHSEAFNTTMLEANACGCPVLSYNRYCFPEFVVNGVNGFLGETQMDLEDAVRNLGDIDRAACRKHFENGYTAEIMAANYLDSYRSSF